ncbi:MAG: fibronectin type III domain-containing protein, partial [Patescibacteria group bacterium]|nr:fibronectin type III domain-containing protein [Patescibacteria group bacterium]
EYWTDDADYTVSSVLRMRDGYKDYDSNNANYKFEIDNTAPVVAITNPGVGWLTGIVDIRGSVEDKNPDHYYLVIKDDKGKVVAGPKTVNRDDSFTDESLFNWDTTQFADGNYIIYLAARDEVGNRDPMANTGTGDSVEVICVTIDNSKPVLEIRQPEVGSLHSQQMTLEGYAEDNLKLRRLELGIGDAGGNDPSDWCQVINETDGFASPATITCENVDISQYTDGDYTAVLIGQDVPRNYKKEILGFTIDNTPPISTITSPNPGEYFNAAIAVVGNTSDEHNVTSVTLSYSVYDDELEKCGVDYSDIITLSPATATNDYDWNYDWTPEGEGKYCLKAQGLDEVGNQENTAVVENIIYDKTIPEIDLTVDPDPADGDNGWYVTKPTITLTATDPSNSGLDYIQYQWDGQDGPWTTVVASTTTTQPDSEGTHRLYYRAVDLAGNESTVDETSETGVKTVNWDETELDDTDLEVSVSPNPTSGDTATVSWKDAVDNIGIDRYEVKWDLLDGDADYGKTVSSSVTETEIDRLEEGTYKITLVAYDKVGHSRSDTTELVVDRSAPAAPILSLYGTGEGSVDLSWTVVDDANSYIIYYGVNPGDYVYAANVGDTTSYTVEGLTAGSYYFVVRAVDSVDNQSPNSNEVNGNLAIGAAGATGGAAEGFAPAGEVAGTQTEEEGEGESESQKQATSGEVKGVQTSCKQWRISILWILLALQAAALFAVEIYYRKDRSAVKHVISLGIALTSILLFYLLGKCTCYADGSLASSVCNWYWAASLGMTFVVKMIGYGFIEIVSKKH